MLTVLLLACGAAPSPDGPGPWVTMPEQAPIGVDTRFRGAPVWTPRPDEAFSLRDLCPHVTEARVGPSGAGSWVLELKGERLDRVTRAGALLPQDKRADIVVHHDDGGVQLAVGCAEVACQVLLGVTASEGRTAACTGPGYSLWVKAGAVYAEDPG